MITFDSYLQTFTVKMRVLPESYELHDRTVIGTFPNVTSARNAVNLLRRLRDRDDVALAIAEGATLPWDNPDTTPEPSGPDDVVAFAVWPAFAGVLSGALLLLALSSILRQTVMRETPWFVVSLPATLFGAILGGLYFMYFRLGKSSTWNESATADQQAFVAVTSSNDSQSDALSAIMLRNEASAVEIVDSHGLATPPRPLT